MLEALRPEVPSPDRAVRRGAASVGRAAAAALLAALVAAPGASGSEPIATAIRTGAERSPKRTVRHLADDLVRGPAYRDFVAANGEPDEFEWNLENGTVRGCIVSIPLVAPGEKAERGELLAAVADFVDAHEGLFGAGSSSFTLGRRGYVSQPHRIAYVWLEQTLGGIPVHGAGAIFSIHVPSGRLVRFGTRDLVFDPAIELLPAISPDDAARLACGAAQGLPLRPRGAAELRVLPTRDGSGRLVYSVETESADSARPAALLVHVDARDGAIAATEDLLRTIDVTGTIGGRGQDFDPTSQPITLALSDMAVRIVGGETRYTDANGAFVIPNPGTSSVTVQSLLTGRWVTVQNRAGATDSFTAVVTPPGPVNYVYNADGSERGTAQVNGAYHTTRVHNFLAGRLGASGLDVPLLCNVNESSTCNAYYDGASINFLAAGGGCVNTAFDTIVYHEYGHFADDVFGGIADGGLSEGWGDVVAMFLTNQPIVGEGFSTGGGFVRTGWNGVTWPGAGCGGEVHCLGQIFMGYAWRAREKLMTQLGVPAGAEIANQDFIDILPANSFSILDAVKDTFVADDDDGVLGNGTPHFAALAAAADEKNLTHPTLRIVRIAHTPLLDTRETVNAYPVVATATSTQAAIAGVTLTYRISGGADVVLPMDSIGGNQYAAAIPPQYCGRTVEYHITATDGNDNVKTSPELAPSVRYAFGVGDLVPLYSNDFEGTTAEGWSHFRISTDDDWHRKAPNPFGTQPWDPRAAFSGTKVWGTDLEPGSAWDGNYAANATSVLQSPPIRTSGYPRLTLRYRRWLTVEDGLYDTAQILANGAEVWRNPIGNGSDHVLDSSWVEHSVTMPAAETSVVWFLLSSDIELEFGGWTIDDVRVYGLSCVSTLSFSTPTPSIGQPVTVTVSAGPNENYYFLYSRSRGSSTFVPAGGPPVVTGLDRPRPKRSGLLDASGGASFDVSIPARPNLVGLTAFFQAVDGAGRASGVQTLTIRP